MPKRGSCGSVLPGCRLSKQHPSINSLAVHGCTSRACRDAHCTTFGSPVCRRPLLSRCPTSRDFVPWRFLDAGQLSARVFHCCRRPKTSTNSDVPTNSIDDRQRHQFGMKSARPTTPRENRSTDGIEQTALEQKQRARPRTPICISGDVAIRGPRTVPAY
jgi:hypothetical protein